MKFSMVRSGERFTVPGSGLSGEQWILKLPDPHHSHVPQNEFAMMSLANRIGIDVPEIRLVHRDNAFGLPTQIWPAGEEYAYAIKRFDRGSDGSRIHIEDFAQVRGFLPHQKYDGTLETVAALSYRGHDLKSLHQFVRRLVLNYVIGNGDAHLKNWSFIYLDGTSPTLSPAYDIVSTAVYLEQDDLGLKFGGSRRFTDLHLDAFRRLARKLELPEDSLTDVATETFESISQTWTLDEDLIPSEIRPWLADSVRRFGPTFSGR